MSRFVGVKNGSIRIISDAFFINDEHSIVELPGELDNIPAEELMLNYHMVNDKVQLKKIKKPVSELKVAFVTNLKMRCGISTYSEFLINELIKQIPNFKIFNEYNSNPTQEMDTIGGLKIDSDKIIECWRRGDPLNELMAAIDDYQPDIILIQHEFGLFPNAMYWLSFISRMSKYRIITTMHSVFYHEDKTIVEASMPEIIVHLEGAKDVLRNHKKLNSEIHVIPHGCFECLDTDKLWNFYKSKHTFMTQGFSFRYKNFGDCIKATALLKTKYPDIFFTGLLSESDFNKLEHQLYYEELLELSKKLGVEDNVSLIRGFQSENVMNSFLRTNQVAVFPYYSDPKHIVFGASGASRMAMSKGIPVITSSIPHFSDLPTIKANSSEEISKELDILFSSSKSVSDQVNKQNTFLKENSWSEVAKQYINVFTS